jgi:hypothetical protein
MTSITRSAALDQALVYVAHIPIFPADAHKRPLVSGGFKAATADQGQIEIWWSRWPHADPGYAVPRTIVVVDIDVKNGRDGYADFRRIFGCDPRTVATPSFMTPSGGMQLLYAASKLYRNAVAVDGTGIDTRALGGYTILPVGDGLNGRRWLWPLIGTGSVPPLPAPGWLDRVIHQSHHETTVLQIDKSSDGIASGAMSLLPPLTEDLQIRRQALVMLARACERIRTAPDGKQGDTRRKQCFFIGGLVGRGDLDFETAFAALLAASQQMPVYRPGEPWRDLEMLTGRSLLAGAAHPLSLSAVEAFIRRTRAARQRLRQGAAHA